MDFMSFLFLKVILHTSHIKIFVKVILHCKQTLSCDKYKYLQGEGGQKRKHDGNEDSDSDPEPNDEVKYVQDTVLTFSNKSIDIWF